MALKRTSLLALWLALFAFVGTSHATAPEPLRSGSQHGFFTAELATSLDSDGQVDWIRAYPCAGPSSGSYYCVRVVVSQTHSVQTIVLKTNAKGVRITSHDADGDHLQDVLVMSADDGSPLGVWINDGRGGFKESDVSNYSASVWHEDPLLCASAPPDRVSLASINGVHDFCRNPFAVKEPLLDAHQTFGIAEVLSPLSSLRWHNSGRAPPAR